MIEAKASVNRTVVAQLLVARDLIAWQRVRPVDLVAVVTRDDAAIRGLCDDVYGIRVEVVPSREAG